MVPISAWHVVLIYSNSICSTTPFHSHFTDGETEAQTFRTHLSKSQDLSPGSEAPVSRLITSSATSFDTCMFSTAPTFSKHAIQAVVVPKRVTS